MKGSLVKELEEVLQLQGSHVITISILWLNMMTMIKDPMHLLGQGLQMPLLGFVLEFSEILDSKSWNITHTILNRSISY